MPGLSREAPWPPRRSSLRAHARTRWMPCGRGCIHSWPDESTAPRWPTTSPKKSCSGCSNTATARWRTRPRGCTGWPATCSSTTTAAVAASGGSTPAIQPQRQRRRPKSPSPTTHKPRSEELASCLRSLVDQLAEPYRSAVTAVDLDGQSQTEVARALGLSISGMKSRVQRGRRRLRQLLTACCRVHTSSTGGISDYEPGANCEDDPAVPGSLRCRSGCH
jgi:Sigma-70, region 4